MKEIIVFFLMNQAFLTMTLSAVSVSAQEAGSISFEEFCALSLDQQKETLATIFRQRLEFSKNLSYHLTVIWDVVENDEGIDKIIQRENGIDVFSYWQCGGDYKLINEFFREDKGRIHTISTDWNARDGGYRNIYEQKRLNRTFCRIDTIKDTAPMSNDRYAFWFSTGATE